MPATTVARKISAPSQRTGCWNQLSRRLGLGVDPGGDERCIVLSQPLAQGRHDAAATFLDGRHDVLDGVAVQPDAVGEIRRAELLVALAVGAMAGSACREA